MAFSRCRPVALFAGARHWETAADPELSNAGSERGENPFTILSPEPMYKPLTPDVEHYALKSEHL